MYLLDTNIVSLLDPRRRAGAPEVVAWLERNGRALFVSSITLAEMETGVIKLRREAKEARAEEISRLIDGIEAEFADRILAVDVIIARTLPHIGARIFPQNIGWPDLIVAATAEVNGLTILTRNVRHFALTGVPLIDPIANLPPHLT